MTLKKRFLSLLCLTSSLVLVACGGSGGSDSDTPPVTGTPPVTPTPNPTPAPASGTMVSKTVSGQVTYLDLNDDRITVDDVLASTTKVQIRVLDENGEMLSEADAQVNQAAGTANFSTEVSLPAERGSVVVNIEKADFAGYSKRYDFESGETINLALIAELKEAQSTSFSVSANVTASGKTMEGFSFSVSRKPDGKTFLKSGMPRQSTSSGEEEVLSVVVPVSAVPAGVNELTATVRNFDPNDTQDSSSFPGAYADSDGNTLLSVAFDFADVSMPDGTSMKSHVLATKARLSNGQNKVTDPVIINRAIPAASCSALESIGDADADLDGFQVPVYTYNPNSGLWDLLGKGTVYDGSGNMVAAGQTIFDCSVDRYVLEVEVTNEIFLSNWWNLDYPLVFDEPVQACANIELRNTEGLPVDQSIVWVFDDDDQRSFSQDYFIVDENGRARIETVVIDGSDDRSVRLQVWDSFINGSSQTREILLSDDCEDETVTVVTVERPQVCEVRGVVRYENGGLPNQLPIYGTSENLLSFDFVTTAEDGSFSLDLACEVPLEIISLYTSFANNEEYITANVNNVIEEFELNDDGDTVILQDLIVEQVPPIGLVSNGDGVLGPRYESIMLMALDLDRNFPLTYSFSVVDINENVVATFEGSLEEPEAGEISVTEVFELSIPDDAQYIVQGTLTDSSNEESELGGFIAGRDFLE